jgi:two-component system, NtrC family, sensor kinase
MVFPGLKTPLTKMLFAIKYFAAILFLVFCLHPAQAQPGSRDSLKLQLKSYSQKKGYQQDTQYINTLNNFAFLFNQSHPDSCELLSMQALQLSKKINYYYAQIEALKNMALASSTKSKYADALTLLGSAAAIAKENQLQASLARVYHNTGIVYAKLGKYPEALTQYFEALKIRDVVADKIGISSSINGIGAIYFMQEKYTDALLKYQQALAIAKEINYTDGLESAYANIGEVYFMQGNMPAAKANLQQSLALNTKAGNLETRAFLINQIAAINTQQGNYADARKNYENSAAIALQIGSKEYLCRSQLGFAKVLEATQNYQPALSHAKQAIAIATQIHSIELIRDANALCASLYEKIGNSTLALYHFKTFKTIADSINNVQTSQKANNLAADYEYAKKEITLKAAQEKKELAFERKNTRQRWIIFSTLAALFTTLLLAGIIYKNKQKEHTANNKLLQINKEVAMQKATAENALQHLQATQKQLIQAEKMASLGELTAGIAHEIQNPLNFVNNFSEVSKELLVEMNDAIDKGEIADAKEIMHDIIQNLDKVNHHGRRAADIVKGMLQHSRTSSGQKELTSINTLCDEYLRLAYHGLKAKDKSFNAKFETHFDESVGQLNIVPQDMGRVILNIINNAFFAANEKAKQNSTGFQPTVSVATKKEENNIIISITDNGNGIPSAIKEKIFQPFFTTKPTGQGTGLGLSLSYDIVKAHGGVLKVASKEKEHTIEGGGGTRFDIILPTES